MPNYHAKKKLKDSFHTGSSHVGRQLSCEKYPEMIPLMETLFSSARDLMAHPRLICDMLFVDSTNWGDMSMDEYELDSQNQNNGNKNESNVETQQISLETSNEISNEPTDEAPSSQQKETTYETPSQEEKMSHMLRLPKTN